MVKRSVRGVSIAVAVGIVVVGLAACGSSSSSAKPKPTTSSTSSTTSPPAGVGGPTEWVDATERWKTLAPTAFDEGPDAVAEDLAALWRGGDTSEVGTVEVVAVQKGEPAVIVIRESDGPDEAVASVDYEITLEPGDEGWVVSKARAQYACRRAVDPVDPTRCR